MFFFFKILFIYSWETERERESQRHRQREKQAPHREPDAGLDPRSPGAGAGTMEALNRWATQAALFWVFYVEDHVIGEEGEFDFFFANLNDFNVFLLSDCWG